MLPSPKCSLLCCVCVGDNERFVYDEILRSRKETIIYFRDLELKSEVGIQSCRKQTRTVLDHVSFEVK